MIDVELQSHAHVEGEICTLEDDRMLLRDGMLHVALSGGFYIDVSWYPEHDPNGEYVITVYKDTWENQYDQRSIREPLEAAELVRHFAYAFGTGLSSASTTNVYALTG